MKIVKHIFPVLALIALLSACTSDGNSRLVRYKTSDLAELKMYVGSANGVQDIDLITISQNVDSLRDAIASRYFGASYSKDREMYQGDQVSYEFVDDRITYINRATNVQLVSTYEFRNDSLFIDLSDATQYYAGLGESQDSIFFRRGFASSRRLDPTQNKVILLKDTLLTNAVLAAEYGFNEDLSDMTDRDTIVWCNVRYVFGK